MKAEQSERAHESRFHLRRRLGAGGFGEVFEAWDRSRDAVVALKQLKRLSPTSVRRFKQEFRSLAHLSHPNLAQLYELFSDGERWSFTMELVHGVDFITAMRGPSDRDSSVLNTVTDAELGDVATEPDLPRAPRYDPSRLRAALRQLVRGVRALHSAGKLHRDLKPHNVLVSDEGRVVILDFGMVRELGMPEELDPSNFVGTPHYMAPEQAGPAAVTIAADWYSVGVMLYEVLVGDYPVRGRTVVQLLLRKQVALAPSDDAFPAGTPADLRHACQALLRLEAADRPGAEEVLKILGNDDRADAPVVVRDTESEGPLFGRARELASLNRSLARVAESGEPQVVGLVGPSGIGKSAVGGHFAAWQRSLGEHALVWTSRCWENESVPYKALDGIVDALVLHLSGLSDVTVDGLLSGDVAALSRVFPAFDHLPVIRDFAAARPSSSDSPMTRRSAFRALRALLCALTKDGPITLIIDDAQWGDRDSADALVELLAPEAAPALFVLLTYRGAEAEESPFLRRLDEGLPDVIETLNLERLDSASATDLARACGATEARAPEIARESGGDPYLVQQLAALRALQISTVGDAVLHRVAALSADARAFVEALTIAGKPIEASLIGEAAGVDGDLPHVLARLRNERLLRRRALETGEAVEPYHDRIRQALGQQLSRDRRRTLHLRLAQALERRDVDDDELLALHYREGGEAGRSAPYARRAADAALSKLAYDRAASGYADALRDGEWDDADVLELQTRLGTVLSYLGRGNESAEAFVRAAAYGSQIESLALRRRAAEQLLRAGQFVRGFELLDAVLAEVGVRAPRSAMMLNVALVGSAAKSWWRGVEFEPRGEPLQPLQAERLDTVWAAANLMATLDVRRGAYFTFLNARESLDSGDPMRVSRTLALQSVHAASRRGSRKRAAPLLESAGELVEMTDDPFASGAMVDFCRGMAAYMVGDVRTSNRWFSDVERRLTKGSTRFLWEQKLIELYDLFNRYHLGQLRGLGPRTAEAARDAASRNDMMQWSGLMFWRHIPHLCADDPETARADISRAAAAWSVPNVFLLHDFWRLQAEVRVALYENQAEAALATIERNWSGLRKGLFLALDLSRAIVLDLRARAHLALANHSQGRERARWTAAAAADGRRLASVGLTWSNIASQLVLAQVALVDGEHVAAQTAFARAETELGTSGHELLLAAVRLRLGDLLGAQGVDLSERAVAWFETRGVAEPEKFASMIVPVGVDR